MAIILDGKKLSNKILNNLKAEIKKKRLKLKLAVILIGDNKISQIYIREKKNACLKIGIGFELFRFPLDISQSDLRKEIVKIVKNPENSGVVIQLPLPKHFNSQEILNLIPPEKDIDVLSGKSSSFSIISPVVKAISELLKEYKISLKNKNIVVVGKGKLVGQPLILWLEKEKANFSVIDQKTKDISIFTKKADIIISGTGKPNLITGNTIKEGAIVIDAGTSSESGRTIGDVDFESVSKKAKYITLVRGGVGPMTVACLLKNLVKLNS